MSYQPFSILFTGIHLTDRHGQERPWIRMTGQRQVVNDLITIKPETVSHVVEWLSWVPLPSCPLLRCPFPIKSHALSACVSPRTIHCWVWDKSPLSGPKGGPLPTTNGDSGGIPSLPRLISRSLGVLGNKLACQWTRPSGHYLGSSVPGLLLMQMVGQSSLTLTR